MLPIAYLDLEVLHGDVRGRLLDQPVFHSLGDTSAFKGAAVTCQTLVRVDSPLDGLPSGRLSDNRDRAAKRVHGF